MNTKNCREIRIIATSDLHGKFMPWDYALNEESLTGSAAQLASALKEYRNENTVLLDAGDAIQDNSADLFIRMETHPMIKALNLMHYDIFVPGNHEYNYGMDVVRNVTEDFRGNTLTGNVRYADGSPVGKGYAVLERNGVRIAFIGMVTPNILRWDPVNLKGCKVTDPLWETRKILWEIEGKYDVLIGIYHMGLDNEYGIVNSGVRDIAEACPQFDVIVSAHEHMTIPGMQIGDVLIVQNCQMAGTMAVINIKVKEENGIRKTAEKRSCLVKIGDYAPDPQMTIVLEPFDLIARREAVRVIGELCGEALVPENEIPGIPEAQLRDTALMELINTVQMHYAKTEISSAALFSPEANMEPGVIRKCDLARIHKYSNTLYRLRMNGRQLKKYMEWSAEYYNTFRKGDLTISFNPKIRVYAYDMFEGICYEIDISKQPGDRIRNLRWPSGEPVREEESFDIAVSSFRASSALLAAGEIFDEDDLPELLERDVRGEIGGIREMIGRYITDVCGGILRAKVNDNWRLTGYEWDPDLREKAVRLVKENKIQIPVSDDGRTPNIRSLTEDDIRKTDNTEQETTHEKLN